MVRQDQLAVDSVESSFRAAVAKQEDVFTLTALAHLLADLGRNDEAESFFEKALKCPHRATKHGSPSSDGETRGLAMGWYAALVEGNGSEGAAKAEGLYKRALQMNDRDVLAMGNYAVFLHKIKRDHRVRIGCMRSCSCDWTVSELFLQPMSGCQHDINELIARCFHFLEVSCSNRKERSHERNNDVRRPN